MSETATRFTIVGIGEALFDLFPDEQRLGGAPLNVAVHAHQLAKARQGRGIVVSRIGYDDLGTLIRQELEQRSMSVAYLQTDPDRPTGRVYVDFDRQGQPTYDIANDAAWDVIQFDPDLEDLAIMCNAVCFGTLAQRNGLSRNNIYRFLHAARRAVRLFDVNLRQDYYDQNNLRRSCEFATIVKLNEEELPKVANLLGLSVEDETEGARALLGQYDLEMVVLTRGERGTHLYLPDDVVIDGAPASYPPAEGADAVGAGDGCAAAILVGRVLRLPPQTIADLANHVGAFIASQPGATPTLPDAILDMVKRQ